MNPESKDWARLVEAVESLRREVALLGGRVAAIESASAVPAPSAVTAAAPAATASAAAETTSEDISEELILVIGAAVAAYLGKRARSDRSACSARPRGPSRAASRSRHRTHWRPDRAPETDPGSGR